MPRSFMITLLLYLTYIAVALYTQSDLFIASLGFTVIMLSFTTDLKLQQYLMAFIPTTVLLMINPTEGIYFAIWLTYSFFINSYLMLKKPPVTTLIIILGVITLGFKLTYNDHLGMLFGYGYLLGRTIGIYLLLNSRHVNDFKTIQKHTLGLTLILLYCLSAPTLWESPFNVSGVAYGFIFALIRNYHATTTAIQIKTSSNRSIV